MQYYTDYVHSSYVIVIVAMAAGPATGHKSGGQLYKSFKSSKSVNYRKIRIRDAYSLEVLPRSYASKNLFRRFSRRSLNLSNLNWKMEEDKNIKF